MNEVEKNNYVSLKKIAAMLVDIDVSEFTHAEEVIARELAGLGLIEKYTVGNETLYRNKT